MKLIEWLALNDVSYAEFARRIGASNAKVVQRYATGERTPDRVMMPKVVEATGGAVRADDFYTPSRQGAAV